MRVNGGCVHVVVAGILERENMDATTKKNTTRSSVQTATENAVNVDR